MSSPVMLAHRVRVKNLYRHALKCTHNWAIDRIVLSKAAIILRARFDANKNEKNIAVSEKLVEDGEAELARNRHPDPYTQPTDKGGTKWQRNTPVPTSLLENPYVSH